MRWAVVVLAGCGRIGFEFEPSVAASNDAAAQTYAQAVLASAPYAYFHLDEISGKTAFDASPNGRDAHYYAPGGGLTFGRRGPLDGDPAINLVGGNAAGADATVTLPSGGVPWNGDFSIEAFIHPTGSPQVNYADALLVCEDYLTNGFRTGWTTGYRLQLWNTEAGGDTTVGAAPPFDPSQWNHVVFARSGSELAIYLNGAVVAEAAIPDYAAPDSTADCGFGALHGMETHSDFDEVAIYDRAIAASEVAAHYSAR